jgi:hypothetical protein
MTNEKLPNSDQQIWDTLFYGFILTHKKLALSSYVYAATAKRLFALPDSEISNIKRDYNKIIKSLTK